MKRPAPALAAALLPSLLCAFPPARALAADHAEAPLVASDQGADIADVYAFVDPNDNTKVVLAMDVHGFIVPGENGNFGGFDPRVLFRIQIENTGDATPDRFVNIRFEEQTSRSKPQKAHVTISAGPSDKRVSFEAETTVASPTAAQANEPVVTTDAKTGISFFAGLTDDPFFFDIPGFNRFAASVLAGSPDVSLLERGRNTFAGYNIQMIALRVPASMLTGSAGSTIGVSGTTLRSQQTHLSMKDDPLDTGRYVAVDRMGVPAVATVLVPFARKNEYNRSTTQQDAKGKFAGDIVATLTALGTDQAHIGILAGVAVASGDFLRLDTAMPNSGPQGGTSAGAGFPNGRRPADDVVDTLIFLVTNEALATGDHVDANDVPFRNEFPFFADPHQPFEPGIVDDRTRN